MMNIPDVKRYAATAALLFLLLVPAAFLRAQDAPEGADVPPFEGLTAVTHPDLKDLEKDVREQIESFRVSLAAIAAKPPSKEKLGAAYGEMGQIYHAYSFPEPARESYQNAARLLPQDFRWPYLLGRLAQDQNRFLDAVDHYRKAHKLYPDYVATLVNLGDVHLELDLPEAALENYEAALKLRPNDPAALYGLGRIEYAKRNFRGAVEHFEKVVELLPAANRVHYSLALAYRGLKDLEKAKHHISQQGPVGVRVADPLYDDLDELKQGARLRLLRGKQALEAGSYAEAEAEFKKALEADPESVPALVNYGVTLVSLKRYEDAYANLEKALGLDPKNVTALYNLAVLDSLRREHLRAVGHLKRLLELTPQDVQARFLLAKELSAADLRQEALKELVTVYDAAPEKEDVVLELAAALARSGDHKQARDLLDDHLRKFPDRGRTAASLAWVLVSAPQADLRDGKRALELAVKVVNATKTVEHGVLVAMAYAELGRCADAATFTRQLLEKAKQAEAGPLAARLESDLKRYEAGAPCGVEKK